MEKGGEVCIGYLAWCAWLRVLRLACRTARRAFFSAHEVWDHMQPCSGQLRVSYLVVLFQRQYYL